MKILFILDGTEKKQCQEEICCYFSNQPWGFLPRSCLYETDKKRGIYESTGNIKKLPPCNHFCPKKGDKDTKETF